MILPFPKSGYDIAFVCPLQSENFLCKPLPSDPAGLNRKKEETLDVLCMDILRYIQDIG